MVRESMRAPPSQPRSAASARATSAIRTPDSLLSLSGPTTSSREPSPRQRHRQPPALQSPNLFPSALQDSLPSPCDHPGSRPPPRETRCGSGPRTFGLHHRGRQRIGGVCHVEFHVAQGSNGFRICRPEPAIFPAVVLQVHAIPRALHPSVWISSAPRASTPPARNLFPPRSPQ